MTATATAASGAAARATPRLMQVVATPAAAIAANAAGATSSVARCRRVGIVIRSKSTIMLSRNR